MRIIDGAGLALLASVLAAQPASAQVAECPLAKSDAADVAVGNIRTWHDFAAYRKEYAACDDGGTAEGSSSVVVHMLATEWNTLPALKAELTKDLALKPFLYRHINTTVDGSELEAISKQTTTQCPPHTTALCKDIRNAAARALAELR